MSISSADALFQPRVFSRTCIGAEALVCVASDAEGAFHITTSVSVKFAKAITQDELEPKVKAALIRLRHLVPAFALTVSKLPTNEYQQSYHVPGHLADVERWVSKVLFFEDGKGSFVANHEKLARTRFWKASDGAYLHELLVASSIGESAATNAWTLSLSSLHLGMDGRSVWMLFDKLLAFVSDEINGHAPPLESLGWGKEVVRLPDAPHVICDVHEKGAPQPFPEVDGPPAFPEGFQMPFMYKPLASDELDGKDDELIYGSLVLTQEETARLHSACREHGRTVTQVFTALLNLANVEVSLRVAGNNGLDHYQTVRTLFELSTHLLTFGNPANMRSYLPDDYRTFDSKYSTPLLCVDMFPLAFAAGPYKKAIKADGKRASVSRVIEKEAFWEHMVKDVADAWKAEEISISAYKKRAVQISAISNVEEMDMEPIMTNAPSYTSLGDLGRLGLLESFRPSAMNGTLTVDDIEILSRYPLPGSTMMFFEYDGRFRLRMVTGRKYAGGVCMDLRIEIVKEIFDIIF